MSGERVTKALTRFGFAKKDMEAYVFLARMGLDEATSIEMALNIYYQGLANRLKILESKGIIRRMGN